MSKAHLIKHPLIQHKLSFMRKKETKTPEFRRLMKEVSLLMAYEVTKDLPSELQSIETPLCQAKVPFLSEKNPVLVSILRAGNGLLDGFLDLMPCSKVGYVGLYREEKAKRIVEYYFKLPSDISERRAIVVDPMLATGHSADVALNKIKAKNPVSIKFVSLLSSKSGINYLQEKHPDVQIFTAAIDEELNDKAYIVPGLGDAGDRLFGTD